MDTITYANRLPVDKTKDGWRPSTGGLVSALRPALRSGSGAWVGWDGGGADVPRRVAGLPLDLVPVRLTPREIDDYYHGFSNRTLWPLLHGLIETPVYDRAWWQAYRRVNERFAEAPIPLASEGSFRWVHDYQLMLVPELLRNGGHGDAPIGFFLHVPFPPPEIFSRLPWREQVLDGLLGADAISFHTESYLDNFLRTCSRVLVDLSIDGTTIRYRDRTIQTAAHPISIDAHRLRRQARSSSVAERLAVLRSQFRGRRVLVGVDRLDYTKGILERLRAIELVLERMPELHGQIVFVQVAVPTRGEIHEYRELRQAVEKLVGRINGRFTEPGHDVPVHYLYRSISYHQLLAYYRLADVCLVTPLADGMNLVAKEFVTAQAATGGSGVLVLSEFAGAAAELTEALPCNPFDVSGSAGAIALALELDAEDRRSRIAAMAARIAEHDVFSWLDQELGEHAARGA